MMALEKAMNSSLGSENIEFSGSALDIESSFTPSENYVFDSDLANDMSKT